MWGSHFQKVHPPYLVEVLDELDAESHHALLVVQVAHVAAQAHVRVDCPLLGHAVDLQGRDGGKGGRWGRRR